MQAHATHHLHCSASSLPLHRSPQRDAFRVSVSSVWQYVQWSLEYVYTVYGYENKTLWGNRSLFVHITQSVSRKYMLVSPYFRQLCLFITFHCL